MIPVDSMPGGSDIAGVPSSPCLSVCPVEAPLLPSYIWESLWKAGLHQARCQGIPPEEVEDCALEFVYHLTGDPVRRKRLALEPERFRPFVYRCAANHAKNYRRHLNVRLHRHVSLSDWGAPGDLGITRGTETNPLIRLSEPEACILRAELRQELQNLIATLEPSQQLVFVGRAVEEERFAALAVCLGRSENAVRLIYGRARQHLQRSLAMLEAPQEEDRCRG